MSDVVTIGPILIVSLIALLILLGFIFGSFFGIYLGRNTCKFLGNFILVSAEYFGLLFPIGKAGVEASCNLLFF
jgi:hypothetical protein